MNKLTLPSRFFASKKATKINYFLYQYLSCLLFILTLFVNLKAQQWQRIGISSLNEPSSGSASFINIAKDKQGNLFMCYSELITTNLYVRKYDGTKWQTIGTPGFVQAGKVIMALDGLDNPYIAYLDGLAKKITVVKYNGITWTTLPQPALPENLYDNYHYALSLAVTPEGSPLVAGIDYESKIIEVKKFNGQAWQSLTLIKFTQDTGFDFVQLSCDAAGRVYVVYRLDGNGTSNSVVKYNGRSWELVGKQGFSTEDMQNTTITFDKAGTPYLAYTSYLGTGNIMKFNGTDWINVGGPHAVGNNKATDLSLDFSPSNEPYISFTEQDFWNPKRVSVQRFDGRSWIYVGNKSFTPDQVEYCNLFFDKEGRPAVVYSDYSRNYKATIARFINNQWTTEDTYGLAEGAASFTSLALQEYYNQYKLYTRYPLIAYRDATHANKITVKKLSNGTWSSLGQPGFSDGAAQFVQLVTDSLGTPFVVYQDSARGYKACVQKFTGSSWQPIGDLGFSIGKAENLSIAVTTKGTPYIAYQDAALGKQVIIQKFNGRGWEVLGTTIDLNLNPASLSIALDPSESPYVSFQDQQQSGKAMVIKWDGRQWNYVGNPSGISTASALSPVLAIDKVGTLFLCYSDAAAGYKATVKKFNGTDWQTLDREGFTPSKALLIAMTLDREGFPYIVYQDDAVGGKASVQRFNGAIWQLVGTAGFTSGIATYPSITIDKNYMVQVAVCSGGAFAYQIQSTPITEVYDFVIIGPTTVDPNQQNVTYTLKGGKGDAFQWTAPYGANISSGQGARTVKINFYRYGGTISVKPKATGLTTLAPAISKSNKPIATLNVKVKSTPLTQTELADNRDLSISYQNNTEGIYPNPFIYITKLIFNSHLNGQRYEVTISNSAGKIIQTKSGTTIMGINKCEIDLSRYPAGLYILTLKKDKEVKAYKLTKDQ
jgi:hypothetical protein